jgi:glycosyltransferase involved in cell wall biosynthesis
MLIGIDGNEANLSTRVGVGQYAFNILSELYLLDKTNQYIIYLKDNPLDDLPKPRQNWQYKIFGPSKFWTRLALPFKLFIQKEKLNLFYSPGHYLPILCPFSMVCTIHDIGYLQFKEQFTNKDFYQLVNWTKDSLKKSVHITTVSEFSKTEIINTYSINPSKISVVPNGVGEPPKISPKQSENTLNKFSIKRPYFLYLGTLKPNKNIPFLINAFSKIKNYNLVIAGKKGWLYDEIFKLVTNLKLQDKVIFTGFVNDFDRWALYKNAQSTVLPSTYEGFGIPALESMKAGTPVIVSDIPPFVEVVGKAGIYIDPHSTKTLVSALNSVIDPKTRQNLINLGLVQSANFTWTNSAVSLLKVFQRFE